MANWITYDLQGGEFINASLPSLQPPLYRLFAGQAESASWFEWSIGGFLAETTGWQFTAPLTLGTYTFTFTEQTAAGTLSWTVIINVTASGQLTEKASCCDEEFNIACLNQQGGFQNRPFQGVRTYQIQGGTSKNYKELSSDGDLAMKMASREDIRKAYVVSSGDVTKTEVNSIDQFRQSIQCWRYNVVTGLFDIPIVIKTETYTKYKNTDYLFDVRFAFVDAIEINVQSQ